MTCCWSTWYLSAAVVLVLIFLYLYVMTESASTFSSSSGPRRAIVTGGSSGIGLATAKRLVKKGICVAIIARDQRKLDEAVLLLQRERSSPDVLVMSVSADISNAANIRAAIQHATNTLGGVDILVANAGASHAAMFVDTDEAAFRKMMDVNYYGTLWSVKAVVETMTKQRSGRIIIVGSMAGLSGVAGYTAYGASKFALRGLAESMSMELAVYNVGVSLCCPPDVDTPMFKEENETKPSECKLISAGTGVFTADQVADSLVRYGVDSWRFLICTGFDGQLLSLLSTGTSPASSVWTSMCELCLLGVVRAVSLAYRWSYNRICVREHKKKMAKNKAN